MASANAKRQEERVKLFATALSNVGVATIVTGFIAPLITGRLLALQAAASLTVGLALHFGGQIVLHYVVEDASSAQPAPASEAEP